MRKKILGRSRRHCKFQKRNPARIDIHTSKGIAFNAPPMKPGNPTGKGGGKRGKVTTWSTASRRRMREALLTLAPKDREEVAVTLTIPGPPIPAVEATETFKKFARSLEKRDICAIWRIEIQPRGQLHWHLLAGIRNEEEIAILQETWEKYIIKLGWVHDWLDPKKHGNIHKSSLVDGRDYAIEHDCPTEPGEIYPNQVLEQIDFLEAPGGPRDVINFRHRMLMPGAHVRCVRVERYDGRPNWLRYMHDHATKHKQEQIPEDIGRHWGQFGRKHYMEVLPQTSTALTDGQYYRILRWMQRLATPRILDDRDPFGRRAGYRINRGRFGRTIWFSSPSTVQRMIDLAVALDQD